MRIATILLGAILLEATHGYGVSIDGSSASPITAAEVSDYRPGDSGDHVRVKTVTRESGNEDRVVVTMEIDAGFHINANPASFDYLIPTTLNVTNQTPLQIVYPRSVRFKPKFADDVIDVYEGTVRIAAEFPQGSLARIPYLFGNIIVQACTDEICLPPAELALPGK